MIEKLRQLVQWFRSTRFGRKFLDILYETAVLILYVGAIALLHNVLDWWLGKNALLLGIIPVGYIIDVGHLLAIGLFLLEIIKDAVEVVKGIYDTLKAPYQQESPK